MDDQPPPSTTPERPTPSRRSTAITWTPTLKLPSLTQRPSSAGSTSTEDDSPSPPPPSTKSSTWKDKCKRFFRLTPKSPPEVEARGRARRSKKRGRKARDDDSEESPTPGIASYNEAAAASLPDVICGRRRRAPSPYPQRSGRPKAPRSNTAPDIVVTSPQRPMLLDDVQDDENRFLRAPGT